MYLDSVVNTFGRAMRERYGYKVHKLSINAAFTCPNRDGSTGIGGCTFCNNKSFNPISAKNGLNISISNYPSIHTQLNQGREVILKRTGAKKYLAYFQAYTNTYADINYLKELYDNALSHKDVIGLSIGTRPDCVPEPVLQLLADYQQQGYEVWLELGLQSFSDKTLERVNRGHGKAEYIDAITRAKKYNLQICTHLIIGLPGEKAQDSLQSLDAVLDLGTQGLKFHPLHIVRGTQLVRQWKRGEFEALKFDDYVDTVVEMVHKTPKEIIFHRLTGTASTDMLIAPDWCNKKWMVLNAITTRLIKSKNQVKKIDIDQ
ncbi:MAG: TIGR01212 family radical SAM protein [Pseudomonadota bacterium]